MVYLYIDECDHYIVQDCYCQICGEAVHESIEDYEYGPNCYDGYWIGQVCTACGEDLWSVEVSPALGHNFADGYCTECGAPDPDYVPSECPHNNIIDEWDLETGEYLGDFCQDCGAQVYWP